MNHDDDAGISTAENGRNRIKEVKAMNQDIFPSLDFNCLQRWAMTFAESCFLGAGIHQITLREYNLWNKETPELAKAVRLRSKSHPQYLVIIHLSKQYEHQSRREELIRAVHGPTIWDEQNYLALGIGTAFLDCLKRPTISKLCEEMQRFVFWCYGAQQDENSPETNGYAWPLHADPKGISWLLYPKASSDGKPQIPFPDRFSPSSSGTIQEQVDMKFISEIRDIDDEAFVSLQNLKVLRANIDELMLKYKNYKLFGYRFYFMGMKVVTPASVVFYDSERPNDFKTVSEDEKISYFRDCKGMFYDEVWKYLEGLERVEMLEFTKKIGGFEFILRRYGLEWYMRRMEIVADVFAIPTRLQHDDEVPDHELYFKLLDIVEFLPEPEQPVVYPPIPEWHIPEVVKVEPQPNSFHDKKMRDSNPRFPFHIDIIADQVERWKNEFHLNLSDAFLCRYNLQSEFKAVGIRLHYCIVLLSEEEYPANFINLKNQASPDVVLLDDDFILAYLQKPEYNWKAEWHIEAVSSSEDLPCTVEFDYRLPLLGSPKPDVKNETNQEEKMPREAFVKSLREDVLKVYRIICKLAGKAALDAAVTFLENNPCPYIKPEYLTEDMFPNVNKPDRAFKANIVKVAMLNKGYKPMEQTEIIKILTE